MLALVRQNYVVLTLISPGCAAALRDIRKAWNFRQVAQMIDRRGFRLNLLSPIRALSRNHLYNPKQNPRPWTP